MNKITIYRLINRLTKMSLRSTAEALMPSPTSTSLLYAAAASIWRYPLLIAAVTACLTSFGFDCQVPKPTAGMLYPEFSLKERFKAMMVIFQGCK